MQGLDTSAESVVGETVITGILLSGKKFAGKDTVYEHIKEVVKDRPVVLHKWATTLREDAVRMLNAVGVDITVADLEERGKKELYVPFLQWYGTDFRRAQDYDYWVKRGMQAMGQMKVMETIKTGMPPLFVNTDTRFANEVLIPKQWGFICIRLTVHPSVQYARARILGQEFSEQIRLHPSETALNNFVGFDAVIDNNGSLATTFAVVDEVLKCHKLLKNN